MKTIEELKSSFEIAINFGTSREMRLYLDVCIFNKECECYENQTGDIDLEYYADKLNGAWWMFQELNK